MSLQPQTVEEEIMSKFVVIVFPNEEKATEGARLLDELNQEGSITVYATAMVSKDEQGTITQEDSRAPRPRGMVLGALVGGLVGLLGGPPVAAVGAAGGALMGGWRDMLEIGVGFEFLDEVARELRPGHWAVVSALDEEWVTPLDSRMDSVGGIVVRGRREDFQDDKLRGELDAARADLAQYEAERRKFPEQDESRLETRIMEARARLKRAAERTGARLDRLRQEMEAEVKALQEGSETTDDAKFRKDSRIAAVRTEYQARCTKLSQALEAARTMLA